MKKLFSVLFSMLLSLALFAQSEPALDKEKLFDLYQSQKYGEAAVYLKNVYGDDVNDFKILLTVKFNHHAGFPRGNRSSQKSKT